MRTLLGSIAAVSLLVGGLGIANVMLVSVTERTREIGVRLAVGARRRDILAQFLVEAATLALAGGLGGIAAGLATCWAIAQLSVVTLETLALGVGCAMLAGVVSGVYPAVRASRLEPIEALARG